MNHTLMISLVFGAVIILALVFDLGLLSKKNKIITLKAALYQTIFWVLLAVGFCGFIWYANGSQDALQYISAYLLEWSLSIDNIFVFIIIFSFSSLFLLVSTLLMQGDRARQRARGVDFTALTESDALCLGVREKGQSCSKRHFHTH